MASTKEAVWIVQDGVESLEIDPAKKTVSVGDQSSCYANARITSVQGEKKGDEKEGDITQIITDLITAWKEKKTVVLRVQQRKPTDLKLPEYHTDALAYTWDGMWENKYTTPLCQVDLHQHAMNPGSTQHTHPHPTTRTKDKLQYNM
jgi:hypothetical protein